MKKTLTRFLLLLFICTLFFTNITIENVHALVPQYLKESDAYKA